MIRHCIGISAFFIAFSFIQNANATMEYKQCLGAAVNHGKWVLKNKRLHSSTRFCIRDGVAQARNMSKQYDQDIKPLMSEHYARVKQCKKDKNCKGIPENKITYSTFFEKNCNRPKIKYYHTCDMDRTLRGLDKG